MTIAGDDFSGYVGARWPALVRTLVLLGCPVDDAPDVVSTGLGRCRRGWREATEHDDLDVVVHRAVLDAWADRLRGRWWVRLRPRTDDEWPLPDLSALDRLTPEVRAGLVLRRFAALDPAQAAAVAGRDAGGSLPPLPEAAELRAAGDSVVVLSLPDETLMLDPGPPDRRRRLVVAGAVLAAVAVLVGWTVVATWPREGGPDDQIGGVERIEPIRARNPAEVAWYAEDILHLANATYVLPTLRDLAVLGAGAVYSDTEGRVVLLADDGTRTQIGNKNPQVPFVASDKLGWVAWIDPNRTVPHLLVYDVSRSTVIGDLELPRSEFEGDEQVMDTRPVAIDQETVYYVTAAGARRWDPLGPPGRIEAIEPSGLLDVAAARRVFQVDPETISLEQPVFDSAPQVPGRGGELSADGQYVWTHSPVDGSVLVYDFDSAERVDVRPPGDRTVADVVLAPLGSVTYLTVDPDGFATQEGSDSHPVKGELVTCSLRDGECESLATVVLDNEAPIFAR